MITLADGKFVDRLPESISFDNQVQVIGAVSDARGAELLPLIDRARVLCNIDGQDETTVDLLAFQFQVLFYDATFSIADPAARLALKKKLIKQSFDFHSRLGTPALMTEVLATIYQNITIQEWPAYGGSANHFRLLTDNVITDSNTIASILNTVLIIKRASQTFEGFFTQITEPVTDLVISTGQFVETYVTAPIARVGVLVNRNFIAGKISLLADASVNQASGRSVIAAGIVALFNPTVFGASQPHAIIAGKASAVLTSRVIRNANTNIRAGHG